MKKPGKLDLLKAIEMAYEVLSDVLDGEWTVADLVKARKILNDAIKKAGGGG